MAQTRSMKRRTEQETTSPISSTGKPRTFFGKNPPNVHPVENPVRRRPKKAVRVIYRGKTKTGDREILIYQKGHNQFVTQLKKGERDIVLKDIEEEGEDEDEDEEEEGEDSQLDEEGEDEDEEEGEDGPQDDQTETLISAPAEDGPQDDQTETPISALEEDGPQDDQTETPISAPEEDGPQDDQTETPISAPEEDGPQDDQTEPETEEQISKWDNGQKRFRNTHRLSMCFSLLDDDAAAEIEEAEDSNVELTLNQFKAKRRKRKAAAEIEEEAEDSAGKSKKVRKRRCPNKARDVAPLESRPKLKVVGDAEFEATPKCPKIVPTIRLLTVKYVPWPVRTYNLFPTEIRLAILKDFLRRYAWESNSNKARQRCIDVFENIAYDGYRREQTMRRNELRKLYGNDIAKWKANPPPHWATKKKVWDGLCDVWAQPLWQKMAGTNTANKAKDGGVVHHVAGKCSAHQVGQKLEKYILLKKSKPQAKGVDDMNLWKEAGGDARGRLYGFGYRSFSQECPSTSMHHMNSPTKTTATGASQQGRCITTDELEKVLAERDKQHAIERAKQDALIQKLLAERDSL